MLNNPLISFLEDVAAYQDVLGKVGMLASIRSLSKTKRSKLTKMVKWTCLIVPLVDPSPMRTTRSKKKLGGPGLMYTSVSVLPTKNNKKKTKKGG